ncbi:hypothetical protein FQN55_005026 [Onygenales sp. PD_40]|nr:hypothetical protein FQN55_005026 [Onygenales sp. PD_40]
MQPQYYGKRPDGTFTALVPVDELPPTVSIRGVPRIFPDTSTRNMRALGSIGFRNDFYTIDVAEAGVYAANHDGIIRGTMTIGQDGIVHRQAIQGTSWSPASDERNIVVWRNEVNGTGQETGKYNAGPRQPRGPKHDPRTPPKKEYCSYWIRRGECDYQQQGKDPLLQIFPYRNTDNTVGCLFKHEMPQDPAILEKLGLRDIPRWYREKFGVQSLVASTDRTDGRYDFGHHWRHDNRLVAGPSAVAGYSTPPSRFTYAGITEGPIAVTTHNGTCYTQPPPFASQQTTFRGHPAAGNGISSGNSSLSEENSKVTPISDDPGDAAGNWGNHDLLSQDTLEETSAHAENDITRSSVHDYRAPASRLMNGMARMRTTVGSNTSIQTNPYETHKGMVYSYTQPNIPTWAIHNHRQENMSTNLPPSFQSIPNQYGQAAPPAGTQPKRKPRPHQLDLSQSNYLPTANVNAARPATIANRRVYGPRADAATANNQTGFPSCFSSPIPSPTRAPSYLSSRSVLTAGPSRRTATPASGPLAEPIQFNGHKGRYGKQAPNPIGYNQNGEDYRERKTKQAAEADPFGVGLDDDNVSPSSGSH